MSASFNSLVCLAVATVCVCVMCASSLSPSTSPMSGAEGGLNIITCIAHVDMKEYIHI